MSLFKRGTLYYSHQFHNDLGTAENPTAPEAQLLKPDGSWAALTAPAQQNSKVGLFGGSLDMSNASTYPVGRYVLRIAGTVTTAKVVGLTEAFELVESLPDDVAALAATAVWGAGTKALTDKAGFSLAADQAVNVTKVGGTAQTAGDIYGQIAILRTRLGVPSVDLTTDVAAVKSDTAAVKAKTDNIPSSPAAVGSAMALTSAYDHAKDDVYGRLGAPTGASIAADIATRLAAAGYTAPDNATISAIAGYVDTEVAAIKAKTDNLPATPASKADADAATSAANDAKASADLANRTAPDNAGVAAIKAKTDNLPASPAATGAAMSLTTAERNNIASTVWTTTSRQLSVGGISAIVAAIWDEVTSSHSTTGSFAKLLKDYLDAAVSAVKAKTDGLPADPASESLLEAAVAAIPQPDLSRLDVAVSTRLAASSYAAPDNSGVAAIKAKTDNLPSDPADESLLEAAIAAATPEIDLSTVTLPLAAVKARTDNLPADPASQADILEALSDALDLSAVTSAIAALGEPAQADALNALEVLVQAVKAVTDGIDASPLTVTFESPVSASGVVTVEQGDSYAVSHGRIGLPFLVADSSHSMSLDGDGVTVQLRSSQQTWEAASVVSTEAGWTVIFTPTVAETAALTISEQIYKLMAIYGEDDVRSFARGTLTVEAEIPEIP